MALAELQGATVPIKLWSPVEAVESQALDQLKRIAALPWAFHHVAVMPDVHYGKGATVGSVIAMRDALAPAAVGVDIGCFVGDTKVPLLDGTQQTLADLATRADPFWVYSVASGCIVPGRATCAKTRTDADLLRVLVSGGDEIVCTPDHRFMLSDGTFREARCLQFNDSLMPLYRAWATRDGYESVHCGKGTARLTHHTVWEAVNGTAVPKGHVVHHENHNHFDNRPENLRLMTVGAHSAHHRATGHTFANSDPAFQALRRAGVGRSSSQPGRQAQLAEVGTRNIKKYMEDRPEHFREATAGNGRRGAPSLFRFNITPRECRQCPHVANNPAALRWHVRREHAAESSTNHKVIAVQRMDRRADVFCLQVDEHHNFALAAGVFVHNCGMAAVRTSLRAEDLPESLRQLRSDVEAAIPVGFNGHESPPAVVEADTDTARLWGEFDALDSAVHGLRGRAMQQVGTLGGGNHFIELCLDTDGAAWLMLHSGSRNIGKSLAEIHIERARELAHNAELPDRDLAVFLAGTEEMAAYRRDLFWAQRYAMANRRAMLALYQGVIRRHFPAVVFEAPILCHHNYVAEEVHYGADVLVTRKGAISARAGEMGIIPGSMGTASYIVRGLGNPESFCSASHGAGRRMSRGAAKRSFTTADLAAQTAGVECRKDDGVLDEIPAAYKPIGEVMANQADLVEVVAELRQVMCVKG